MSFGGNAARSHFSVTLRADPSLPTRSERSRRFAEQKATLKANGFASERYFEFFDADKDGKVKAKAAADHLASEILRRTGIRMAVHEGCFA